MSRNLVDSGIEWIGKIPSSWSVCKVKNKYDYHKNIAGADCDSYERIALTLNGVIKRDKEDANGLQPENYNSYQVVYKGDLIFKLIDLENVNTSRIGKSDYEGITSPAYIVLTPKENNNYGTYYFLNMWYQEIFNNLGGNGVRSALNKQDLLNIPYLNIPKEEQNKITAFLDDKCKKIDSIIADNNKEIELLNEYITSYIDSCICNFDKIKMKKLSESIGDGLHGTPEYSENGEYYFVNGNNIGDDYLNFKDSTDRISKEEYLKYKEKNINDNTILITLNGATYGKTSFYNGEKIFLGKSAGFITLKKTVDKQYIRLFLMSSLAKKQFDLSLAGSTIANLSLETLNNLMVPFPSEDIQKNVSNKIIREINLINKCIDFRKKIIDKLEEYKKSLIYEVVTGKKEV